MPCGMPISAAVSPLPVVVVVLLGIVAAAIGAAIVINYGGIWFRAYMSNANVSLLSLIGMSFRRVDTRTIVQGKIMAVQAGIGAEAAHRHHAPGGWRPTIWPAAACPA